MCEEKKQSDMLLPLLHSHGIKSIAIVGMAKNVGKTVTLNYLVQQAAGQGLCLGLTSVGRDGEKRDEVFHTPKPRIFAPAGCLVATARGTLKHSEIEIEMIQESGFHTAMGEVIIGRALQAGYVELAGPTLINHHRILLKQLMDLGANLVLVDGALDRVSSATPSLAQGIILATGAALASSPEEVMKKTKDRIERFTLPSVDPCNIEYYQSIMEQGKAALVDMTGEVRILPAEGSLNAGKLVSAKITPTTRAIVMSGAVGDGVLEGVLASKIRRRGIDLVLRNGTCLFSERSLWRKFIEQGGSIQVVEPIRLLAITLNPTSVQGPQVLPQEFFEMGSKMLAPYPVMDVVMGCRR